MQRNVFILASVRGENQWLSGRYWGKRKLTVLFIIGVLLSYSFDARGYEAVASSAPLVCSRGREIARLRGRGQVIMSNRSSSFFESRPRHLDDCHHRNVKRSFVTGTARSFGLSKWFLATASTEMDRNDGFLCAASATSLLFIFSPQATQRQISCRFTIYGTWVFEADYSQSWGWHVWKQWDFDARWFHGLTTLWRSGTSRSRICRIFPRIIFFTPCSTLTLILFWLETGVIYQKYIEL